MTIGVGGSSAEAELARLEDMTGDVAPIGTDEIKGRLARAQNLMQTAEIDVLYIHAGTNLLRYMCTRMSTRRVDESTARRSVQSEKER